MKSVIQFIAVPTLALFQFAPAHADRYAFDWEKPGYQAPNAQPGKSRAQILEELVQARASGELDVQDNAYPDTAPVVSTRTREAVRQEVLSAPSSLDSSLYRY